MSVWDVLRCGPASRRKRLLDLARSAGLPVDDHTLIDEPIAAGVAWVNNRIARSGQGVRGQLLVFDMGGGTLDVAVLDVHADLGEDPEISVLSSWGIDEAGDALDEALADELERQLGRHGIDMHALPNSMPCAPSFAKPRRKPRSD